MGTRWSKEFNIIHGLLELSVCQLHARFNCTSAFPFAASFWEMIFNSFQFLIDHVYRSASWLRYQTADRLCLPLCFSDKEWKIRFDAQKSGSASNRPWAMKALAWRIALQICHFLPALSWTRTKPPSHQRHRLTQLWWIEPLNDCLSN